MINAHGLGLLIKNMEKIGLKNRDRRRKKVDILKIFKYKNKRKNFKIFIYNFKYQRWGEVIKAQKVTTRLVNIQERGDWVDKATYLDSICRYTYNMKHEKRR